MFDLAAYLLPPPPLLPQCAAAFASKIALFTQHHLRRCRPLRCHFPIASPADACHLPSSSAANCSRASTFTLRSCTRSSSSNAISGFFARLRRQQALLPLGSVVAECSPCHSGRVRLIFRCVAFACQRLATAPTVMRMAFVSRGWAGLVMERVTRGRMKSVQVRVQRRACYALRCAVCLTRAAGNDGRFSGLLLRIVAAASSTPRRSFLCAGCCCRPRFRGSEKSRRGSIPAQHRSAAMTRCPRVLHASSRQMNKSSSCSCRRCYLAITAAGALQRASTAH